MLLLLSLMLSGCAAVRGGSGTGDTGTTGTAGSTGTTGTAGTDTGIGAVLDRLTGSAAQRAGRDSGKAIVRVFYGTDRSRGAPRRIGADYGSGRAALQFGYVDVSIPREHRMGRIERPSVFRLEFRENPEKHITLLSVAALDAANWRKLLAEFSASRSSRRGMVFVHGFNVGFDDASLAQPIEKRFGLKCRSHGGVAYWEFRPQARPNAIASSRAGPG